VHSKKGDYYSFYNIQKVLDRLADAGVVVVNLYGGEPTLHPKFIEIGEYAKDLGLSVGFLSNGYNIREENINKITDIFEACTISLHGFRKEHELVTKTRDSYFCATNAIGLLDREGFNFAVATTVSTLNLFKFSDHIKYLNFKYPASKLFIVNRASYTGASEEFCLNKGEIRYMVEQVDKLETKYNVPTKLGVPVPPELLPAELRKYSSFCSSGTDFGNINGDGDVKMCYSLGNNPVIGNVLTKSFNEIWNSKYMQEYRTFEWAGKRCNSCRFFNNCFCGCKRQVKGGYGVDPIINSKYQEYFVLVPKTKKRIINGVPAYSNLKSVTVLIDNKILCKIIDSLSKPKSKEQIILLSGKYKINCDTLIKTIEKLLEARVLKKIFRDNLEIYGL